MDVSTAMENNTTEYENEKLVLENAAKRKLSFGNDEDLKEHIATNENDTKRKIPILKRKQNRRKHVTCTVCFKSMRGDKLNSEEEKSDYEARDLIDMYATNKKRRAYCKTKAGIETNKKCKENANVKRHISNHLSMIHGSYETIKKLVKML